MHLSTPSGLRRLARRAAGLLALCAGLSLGGPAPAQDIVVGQIGPFDVHPFPEAREVRDGARACFEQVNRGGGVRGRKLSLFTLDDELSGPVFLQRFREAMARQPMALLTPIGSAALGSLLASKALDTADVVVIGAIPGAEAFRQPGHPRLFHIRAGDKVQLERILLHSQTLGLQRIHVISQDLAVGQSGLAVLRAAAQQMGGLTLSSSSAALTEPALHEAVQQAIAAAAQATIVIGYPQFMAEALARLRQAGVRKPVFALGYLPPALAVQVAGLEAVRGLGITQAFPNPNGHTLPIQREFQAAMQHSPARGQAYTAFQLEGWVAARVLVEGLRRTDGPLTPAALARALHAMGELDLGGFRIRFGEGQVGSVWTDIGVVSETGKLLF